MIGTLHIVAATSIPDDVFLDEFKKQLTVLIRDVDDHPHHMRP